MSVVSVPKLWMHYLVGVSHFAKYGTNRLLTVWELRKQRNANKCPKIAYSSVVKKMKVIRNPRADPDHHQKSITSRRSSLVDVRFRVRQLSCLQNDRTNERMTENDHITPALLAEVIIIIIIIILLNYNVLVPTGFVLVLGTSHCAPPNGERSSSAQQYPTPACRHLWSIGRASSTDRHSRTREQRSWTQPSEVLAANGERREEPAWCDHRPTCQCRRRDDRRRWAPSVVVSWYSA